MFAPNANSYRRFRRMSYAPVAPTWGINNRSVSLRVPAGPAASRHIEHRVSGADANPYLVAASVLGGVRVGLDARLDPGPPVTGNGYATESPATLPRDWLERDPGRRVILIPAGNAGRMASCSGFVAIKTRNGTSSTPRSAPTDYDWYLETV